jgi:hypothetical protein
MKMLPKEEHDTDHVRERRIAMKIRIALCCLCPGITVASALGVPPAIHVAWGEPEPPVLGVDYVMELTPGYSPAVK